MKNNLKRMLMVGMAGLMVLGGGISAFADDVEVELPDMKEKAMIRHRIDRDDLKDEISGLSEDIQEQLAELKGMIGENRDLAKDIIGIEGRQDQWHANGAKKAARFAGKFEEKFEGKLDNLRENYLDKAERLEEKFEGFKSEARAVREKLFEEREALREERRERIDELKEEYPDEFQVLEGNREEMKELRSDLRQAIESGDEDEIENIIEEMKAIVEENKEILEAVSDLEE